MEQLKALANDPAKLEAKLKEDWAKIDTKGEGAVTFEVFAEAGKKMQQALNLNKEPTDEEIDINDEKSESDPSVDNLDKNQIMRLMPINGKKRKCIRNERYRIFGINVQLFGRKWCR